MTLGFFPDTLGYAENQKNFEKKKVEELDLKKIIQVDFPDDQYYREQTKKKQIVLHHTVSGQGAQGDLNWWLSTESRIATHMVVDWEGKIYQCYSSKYWAHHLGCKRSNNRALNKASIGIEIDSWGGLVRHNRQWHPAKWDGDKKMFIPNTRVAPIKEVQVYPEKFRGFHAFEKYTNAQLEAVYQLLVYWKSRYNIPLTYNDAMWDVNEDALSGKAGLWTHVSFRKDKSDCHPQPELISMLKSL
jgi:N-acetyl-anhydromuramyl-L-alanine amidase AmpD